MPRTVGSLSWQPCGLYNGGTTVSRPCTTDTTRVWISSCSLHRLSSTQLLCDTFAPDDIRTKRNEKQKRKETKMVRRDFLDLGGCACFWLDNSKSAERGGLREATTTTQRKKKSTLLVRLENFALQRAHTHPHKHDRQTRTAILTRSWLTRRNPPTSRKPSPSSTSAALDACKSTL